MQLSVLEQYRELHKNNNFCRGTAIKGYLGNVEKLVKETGAKTILDYGCGKATFYKDKNIHKVWGVEPYLYDPGVPEFSKKPSGKFDGVICTDVLEHVENPEEVLEELCCYARKFMFLTISCRPSPAHKTLLDGRGLHISVHPREWWLERIKSAVKTEVHFDTDQ